MIICKLVTANETHLEAMDLEVMLNSLLLTVISQKDDPTEATR
jgi:hypothetical protein